MYNNYKFVCYYYDLLFFKLPRGIEVIPESIEYIIDEQQDSCNLLKNENIFYEEYDLNHRLDDVYFSFSMDYKINTIFNDFSLYITIYNTIHLIFYSAYSIFAISFIYLMIFLAIYLTKQFKVLHSNSNIIKDQASSFFNTPLYTDSLICAVFLSTGGFLTKLFIASLFSLIMNYLNIIFTEYIFIFLCMYSCYEYIDYSVLDIKNIYRVNYKYFCYSVILVHQIIYLTIVYVLYMIYDFDFYNYFFLISFNWILSNMLICLGVKYKKEVFYEIDTENIKTQKQPNTSHNNKIILFSGIIPITINHYNFKSILSAFDFTYLGYAYCYLSFAVMSSFLIILMNLVNILYLAKKGKNIKISDLLMIGISSSIYFFIYILYNLKEIRIDYIYISNIFHNFI